MSSISNELLELVKRALAEDIGRGDITSLASLEPYSIKGKIIAKSEGVLSGLVPTLLAFEIVDSAIVAKAKKKEGDSFKKNETIITLEGFNQTLLTSERTALNFLGHLSGVATLTNKYVNKVNKAGHSNCRIIDTRKTLPGMRQLQKNAVVHGGGENHRMGLYDMILIKDNHIASCGSIKRAVELMREYFKSPEFRLQFDRDEDEIEIEIEMTCKEQVTEAVELGIKRLLLDNQTVAALQRLVKYARGLDPKIKLEASGNVSLENVAEIAASGVDYISVGALTHSAPAVDFSLEVTE